MKLVLAALLAALSFQTQAAVIVRPVIIVRPAPRISAPPPPPKPVTAQPKPATPAESTAVKTEVINRPVMVHPVIIQSSNCTDEKKKQGQGCR